MELMGCARDVGLLPSRGWSEAASRSNGHDGGANGDGKEKKLSLLGLSLRACHPAHALESVYHVLDVLEGSPAEVQSILTRGEGGLRADTLYPLRWQVRPLSALGWTRRRLMESAGLVPWGDFVLAWSGGPLHSENDFYNLIEAHVDRPLRLFVYNSDLDNLREVVLYPTRQWGGEGLIGCGIG